MDLKEKSNSKKSKKILSLDGGGIRGLISIEILAKIEQELRDREENPNLVLSDYFDFVAGTSTGALIAAAICIGMPVDEIRKFYVESGAEMFDRKLFVPNLGKLVVGHAYSSEILTETLQEVFGKETTLGSEKLKTLLLIVMHNTKTDSPWPLSNNPKAKYNDLERNKEKSNLHLPLWQLLRASTAAPTFFEPEVIEVGDQKFSFVDGAMTPYNNPAFQAYLMSTLKAYNLNWEKGEDKLLLVSVGTGSSELVCKDEHGESKNLYHHAKDVPVYLLNSISYQQDLMCRVFGKCKAGASLDSEIGDLHDENGAGCTHENLFTYLRYDVKLDEKSLKNLGLGEIDPKEISKLDEVKNIKMLEKVGKAVAESEVLVEHFDGF